MIAKYVGHCSRTRIADLNHPHSGVTMSQDGREALVEIVDRKSVWLPCKATQSVPVVHAAAPAKGLRFVCICGRLCTTLYRPPNSDRFDCQKCCHITYKRPSSGDHAHKLRVREFVAKYGLESVSKMAREGLRKRLDAAREQDRSQNG